MKVKFGLHSQYISTGKVFPESFKVGQNDADIAAKYEEERKDMTQKYYKRSIYWNNTKRVHTHKTLQFHNSCRST